MNTAVKGRAESVDDGWDLEPDDSPNRGVKELGSSHARILELAPRSASGSLPPPIPTVVRAVGSKLLPLSEEKQAAFAEGSADMTFPDELWFGSLRTLGRKKLELVISEPDTAAKPASRRLASDSRFNTMEVSFFEEGEDLSDKADSKLEKSETTPPAKKDAWWRRLGIKRSN